MKKGVTHVVVHAGADAASTVRALAVAFAKFGIAVAGEGKPRGLGVLEDLILARLKSNFGRVDKFTGEDQLVDFGSAFPDSSLYPKTKERAWECINPRIAIYMDTWGVYVQVLNESTQTAEKVALIQQLNEFMVSLQDQIAQLRHTNMEEARLCKFALERVFIEKVKYMEDAYDTGTMEVNLTQWKAMFSA